MLRKTYLISAILSLLIISFLSTGCNQDDTLLISEETSIPIPGRHSSLLLALVFSQKKLHSIMHNGYSHLLNKHFLMPKYPSNKSVKLNSFSSDQLYKRTRDGSTTQHMCFSCQNYILTA